MSQSLFIVTDGPGLQQLLPRFALEIRQLANTHPSKDQATEQSVLSEVMSCIAQSKSPAIWPGDLADRFLLLCATVLRNTLTQHVRGISEHTDIARLCRLVDLACSVAAAVEHISHSATTRLCGLWTTSRIAVEDIYADLDGFFAETVAALSPLRLTADERADQVKAQIVINASLRARSDPLDQDVLVRISNWCRELVALPEFRALMIMPAKQFGIAVPAAPETPATSSIVRAPQGIAATDERNSFDDDSPTILPAPEPFAGTQMSEASDRILISLYAQAGLPTSSLSERTRKFVNGLSLDSPDNIKQTVFFAAALELWKAFWTSGDAAILALVGDIARYLYITHVLNPAKEHERSNRLHLWIFSQLPAALRTSSLPKLVDDAGRLCRTLRCKPNELALYESVIEAFAGECRRLELAGEASEAIALRDEYGHDLRTLHADYVARSGIAPEPSRINESAAWAYIFPPKTEPTQVVAGALRNILEDAELKSVVKRGDYFEIRAFISTHRDRIRDMLISRITFRLGPDFLMIPDVVIYDPHGTKRNQQDPDFATARKALENAEYERAAKLFKHLADRSSDFARNMALTYQSYAEAKQGDLLTARILLDQVRSAKPTYSFVYWNLACCLSSADIGKQLDALAEGLDVAPHPRLLHAAVYLGLFSQDRRLRDWLPCMSMAEALLLYYDQTFDEDGGSRREPALITLNAYVRNGEPTVPDPTKRALAPAIVDTFIERLAEARQHAAVEFWFRCRALTSARNRLEFWETRCNFYERTNQVEEGAKAFAHELRLRLSLLPAKLNGDERDVEAFVASLVRDRARRWLERCLSPQWQTAGQIIYDMLEKYEAQYPKLRQKLVPRLPRLTEFYHGTLTPVIETTSTAPDPSANGGSITSAHRSQLPSLRDSFVTVSAQCQQHLHEVSHLSIVEPNLRELAATLQADSHSQAAAMLEQLLTAWHEYQNRSTEAEKRVALQHSQEATANIKACLQRELPDDLFMLTAPLFASLQRVNARLWHGLESLPRITVEPITGEAATVDCDSKKTAVAIRIRVTSGNLTVRLTRARAALSDGTQLHPRDQLELLPVFMGPNKTAVLTFEIEPPPDLARDETVRVDVSYAVEGNEFHTPSTTLRLSHAPCPLMPDRSPYISMRRIEPDEIEGHFFGRDNEQDELLESVRDARIRYIEGIRRSGKSSLLSSIDCEIHKRALPLVPIYLLVGEAGSIEHAGAVLFNIFNEMCRDPEVAAAGVEPPSEERCISNPTDAYLRFDSELASKMPNRKILAMVDEFQALVSVASTLRSERPAFAEGLLGILNLIRGQAKPRARIVWVFAGQTASRRYKDLLPGCLLWANWTALGIDFLAVDAVQAIIREPLKESAVVILDETVSRVHYLTNGHAEPVQQIAEIMLKRATKERRHILTPADADAAAIQLAKENDDTFADTWFPISALTSEEQRLVAEFINAVPLGGGIELYRLAPNNLVTEDLDEARRDLVARKIFADREDGTFGISAPVLEMWLRGNWKARFTSPSGFNGNAAIFIDLANLTSGNGYAFLTGLKASDSEELLGPVQLATVLDRIEEFTRRLTPAPITVKWASNYPPSCPAIFVCVNKEYHNVTVPADLHEKGSDDLVLMWKVEDVTKQYRSVNHFVIVTGDKDFRLLVQRLLQNGHFVHIISRASSLSRPDTEHSYDRIAKEYPQRFEVVRLESLLEQKTVDTSSARS